MARDVITLKAAGFNPRRPEAKRHLSSSSLPIETLCKEPYLLSTLPSITLNIYPNNLSSSDLKSSEGSGAGEGTVAGRDPSTSAITGNLYNLSYS